MPKMVYNIVEGHRILDDGRVCEDVTRIGLPTIEHPTSTIDASGMAMAIDMPNMTHLNAMEFEIAHNNGANCQYLQNPGRHTIEARTVRQRYNVAAGEMEHESVKFRIIGVRKSTEKGSVETNNPLGSTEKYSILRYEEYVNGEEIAVLDGMSGIIKYNGKNYTDEVESLLK